MSPAPTSCPRLHIDLDALAANYRLMARLGGGAATGAAIKADAYGLGLARIAPVLARAGCRSFFCANVVEGAQARRVLGPEAEIFVLAGVCADEIPLFLRDTLIPVLNSPAHIALWRQNAPSRPAALHVDTGMNRLGLPWRDFDPAMAAGLNLVLVMSHLACAATPAHPLNGLQRKRFATIAKAFPGVRASLASSAGTMHGPDFHFDMTRIGIALYGGAPLEEGGPAMAPVVQVLAPILQIRVLEKGDSVGYGADFVAPGPMRLAIVALGYGDGLPRSASPGGFARFCGHKAPIVGHVSMDLTEFDVSALSPPPKPGDMLCLLGEDLEALAKAAQTVPYELLTGLGARFVRDYRGSGA